MQITRTCSFPRTIHTIFKSVGVSHNSRHTLQAKLEANEWYELL